MPKLKEWMVVDEVPPNQSPGSNSLLAGKTTGNFADFGPFGGSSRTNCTDFSNDYEGIPYAEKQGILFGEQAI